MQRAPIVLTATAAGLVATLGFHAHAPAPVSAAAGPSATAAPTSSSSSSGSSSAKTVTSDAVSTPYGNVQLKVTIAGGKITDITPVQLPSADPKSDAISTSAVPLLRQRALAKQSADIDL